MAPQNKARHAGGAAGLGNSSCLAADSFKNIHSQSEPQEAISHVRACAAAFRELRDSIDRCLRVPVEGA